MRNQYAIGGIHKDCKKTGIPLKKKKTNPRQNKTKEKGENPKVRGGVRRRPKKKKRSKKKNLPTQTRPNKRDNTEGKK